MSTRNLKRLQSLQQQEDNNQSVQSEQLSTISPYEDNKPTKKYGFHYLSDSSFSSSDDEPSEKSDSTPIVSEILGPSFKQETKEVSDSSKSEVNEDELLEQYIEVETHNRANIDSKVTENNTKVCKSLLLCRQAFDPAMGMQKVLRGPSTRRRIDAHKTWLCVRTPDDNLDNVADNGCSLYTAREDDGSYRIQSSNGFKRGYDTYRNALETHNPQTVADFLSRNPLHSEALIHFAFYQRMTGHFDSALMLVRRALHILSLKFHPRFQPFVSEELPEVKMEIPGYPGADFEGEELLKHAVKFKHNRSLYVALVMYRNFMSTTVERHATSFKVALEVNKLLLHMSRHAGDPLHCLLHMDILALRNMGNCDFSLEEFDVAACAALFPNSCICRLSETLPSYRYSRALIAYPSSEADECLSEGIKTFPHILFKIVNGLGVDMVSVDSSDGLSWNHLYSDLSYYEEANWKLSEVATVFDRIGDAYIVGTIDLWMDKLPWLRKCAVANRFSTKTKCEKIDVELLKSYIDVQIEEFLHYKIGHVFRIRQSQGEEMFIPHALVWDVAMTCDVAGNDDEISSVLELLYEGCGDQNFETNMTIKQMYSPELLDSFRLRWARYGSNDCRRSKYYRNKIQALISFETNKNVSQYWWDSFFCGNLNLQSSPPLLFIQAAFPWTSIDYCGVASVRLSFSGLLKQLCNLFHH